MVFRRADKYVIKSQVTNSLNMRVKKLVTQAKKYNPPKKGKHERVVRFRWHNSIVVGAARLLQNSNLYQ